MFNFLKMNLYTKKNSITINLNYVPDITYV